MRALVWEARFRELHHLGFALAHAAARALTSIYAVSDEDWFWIYRLNEARREIFVSDSEFGRMPVSDRLRPRYIRAARAFLRVLEDDAPPTDGALDDLSEMKGIFTVRMSKRYGHIGHTALRNAVEAISSVTESRKITDSPETPLTIPLT
jgi:hypothetical protein